MKRNFNIENKTLKCINNKNIELLTCNRKLSDFIEQNYLLYRGYYISDNELLELIELSNESYEDAIVQLIPNKTNIRSGEFGEIISTELYKYDMDCSRIYIVDKLSHTRKEDTQVAAHKTDILIIEQQDDSFIIHSVEVKTKITDSSCNPIEDMIEGVNDDINNRVSETLNWIKRKTFSEGKMKEYNFIKNVIKAVGEGKVDNIYNGIVFLDTKSLDDEINKNIYIYAKLRSTQKGKYDKAFNELGCTLIDNIVYFDGVTIQDIDNLKIKSREKSSIKKIFIKASNKMLNIDDIKIQIVQFENIYDYCIKMYEKIISIGRV